MKYNTDSPPTFIVPNFIKLGDDLSVDHLENSVNSFFSQSDPNWKACIIDDCSTNTNAKDFLKSISQQYPDKIHVIFLDNNVGPGISRNIGILYACKLNSPFVMFNDADDLSHPDRVKVVRRIFKNNSEVGLVYSGFRVIDEYGKLRSYTDTPSSIQEILDVHSKKSFLEGYDVWVEMCTKTGYLNKTSSTSIRTDIAYNNLFPNARASEDFNTWIRISANGTYFKYSDLIPSKYRVSKQSNLQKSRSEIGSSMFNKIKIQMDYSAFEYSLNLYLSKNKISILKAAELRVKFYTRLSHSMNREREFELEKKLLFLASENITFMNLYKKELL